MLYTFGMNRNRRHFIKTSAMAAWMVPQFTSLALSNARVKQSKIHGLLLGGMIGDALGGPVEFQSPEKVQGLSQGPHQWQQGEVMDSDALKETASRCRLISYRDLRPQPEPYAHWKMEAPAGTVTDDSRHKLILLYALREALQNERRKLDLQGYAKAHLDWSEVLIQNNPEYKTLCVDWLEEWLQAARWVLGDRNLSSALPPERLWGGLPTCCGQMSLFPLAGLYPGDPLSAYTNAHDLAFFDNGFARDMNAALVAGLAEALVQPGDLSDRKESWNKIFHAMRTTDPYRHAQVPWVTRSVDKWLDFALETASHSKGQPWLLFRELDKAFRNTIKWEAQVPFTVAFACLALCDFQPLAALQLSIEWGEDTDSYAAIVGAFVGALHGVEVFPAHLTVPVTYLLKSDYQTDIEAESEFLWKLSRSE